MSPSSFFLVDPVGVEPTSKQGISKFSTCLVRNWFSMKARPRTAKPPLSFEFLTITYKLRFSRSLFDEASLPATKSGVIRRDSACHESNS